MSNFIDYIIYLALTNIMVTIFIAALLAVASTPFIGQLIIPVVGPPSGIYINFFSAGMLGEIISSQSMNEREFDIYLHLAKLTLGVL